MDGFIRIHTIRSTFTTFILYARNVVRNNVVHLSINTHEHTGTHTLHHINNICVQIEWEWNRMDIQVAGYTQCRYYGVEKCIVYMCKKTVCSVQSA